MQLHVTYLSTEINTRWFDILVDGKHIATEQHCFRLTLSYEIAYDIPPGYTRGKNKIDVRFQSKQNSVAVGVMDLRITPVQ